MSEQPFVSSDEVEAHMTPRRSEKPDDGERGLDQPFTYQGPEADRAPFAG